MTTRETAAALIADGWGVIPLAPKSKRPVHDGWRTTAFTPEDFSEGMNIGGLLGPPSADRVDIDCDTREALVIAAAMLPRTLTHGRPSKPQSHYWFFAHGCANLTFKDVAGEMLVELRAQGCQTVLPPSVHESGEPLTWGNEDTKPLSLTAEEVRHLVTMVAVGALVARHWPNAGGRHAAAGHIGGILARSKGYDPPTIERLVEAIADAAGDNEARDRARFARTTAEKHAKGEKTTGGPSVKDVFEDGEALVKRLYGWLGAGGDDEVTALNTKHFVVQVGKDVVVATETEDGPIFQTFDSFEKKYYNRFIGKRKLGKFWLEHPDCRKFDRVVFAPPGSKISMTDETYNIWRGFAVDPDPLPHPEQRCARFLDHIKGVIANDKPEVEAYVLDLLADCVQNPGRPIGKTLALRGGQGVGKSVLVESFGKLFGRHFIALSNRNQIVGRFNAHLSGKIVVFADEAIWGGNRSDVGTLKHIVTQSAVPVERKGIDIVSEKNYVHLFLATNDKWVCPAGPDERRFVVLDVTQKRKPSYFDALWQEVESKEFAPALLAVLLARQIDYVRLRAGIETEGLRDQKLRSADVVTKWWHGILMDGQFYDGWPEALSTKSIYNKYIEDMGTARGAGVSNRGMQIELVRDLKELLPPSARLVTLQREMNVAEPGLSPVMKRRAVSCFEFPPLKECRAHFDRITGMREKWPDTDPNQPTLEEKHGDF